MTTGDDGESPSRKVHVSELLAAHGRTVVPSGRRRRRADPDEDGTESAPVEQAPVEEQSATALLDPPRRGAPAERDEVTDRTSTDEVTPDIRAVATADEAEAPADQSPVPAPVPDVPAAPDVPAVPEPVAVVPADQSPVPEVPAAPDQPPVPVVPDDVAVEGEPGATGAEPPPVPVRRNPVREWAVVGAQLVGALVGGAALWFAFRWLWEWHSVVALVLSAVVIVGLVVVVRVLRRAEDLFSTVLAVLAGLIVTVSPPVLTLTGR